MRESTYAAIAVVALLLAIAIVVLRRRRSCAPRTQGMTPHAVGTTMRQVPVPPRGDPDFPAGSPVRWVCDPEQHECTPALWRAAGEPSWATQSECQQRCGRETLRERVRRMNVKDAENVYPYGRTENGAPATPPPPRGAWYTSVSSPAWLQGQSDALEDVSADIRVGAVAEFGAIDEMAGYQ